MRRGLNRTSLVLLDLEGREVRHAHHPRESASSLGSGPCLYQAEPAAVFFDSDENVFLGQMFVRCLLHADTASGLWRLK